MVQDLNPLLGQSALKHCVPVDDPRVLRSPRHSLLAVVTIALRGVLCGVLCGAESWVAIAEFGRVKAERFAQLPGLPNGIAY